MRKCACARFGVCTHVYTLCARVCAWILLDRAKSKDGGARALSLTNSGKDDLQRLVKDQPTSTSRLVTKETGLDQSEKRTTSPAPDQDHPCQDGQTGQVGGTKPKGGLCQPFGTPPIVEVAVDQASPTVEIAMSVGHNDEFCQDGHIDKTTTTEQEIGLTTSRTSRNDDCGLLVTGERVNDCGVQVKDDRAGDDRVSVDNKVTPSSGCSGDRQLPSRVLPPNPAALPRPANQKPASSRPANQRTGMKPPTDLPAKTRVLSDGVKTDAGLECTYQKGGVCAIHGPGAKLRWLPGKWVRGELLKDKRNYFYVCEDAKKKDRKKMTQLKLSFLKKPDDDTKVGEQAMKRRGQGE